MRIEKHNNSNGSTFILKVSLSYSHFLSLALSIVKPSSSLPFYICNNNKFNHLLTDEFVPVNTNADKLYDEMLNLQNIVAFLHRTKINASTDSSVTTGSDLCNVITGAR
ncbi:hypothetical protein JHK82_012447 [Glycine max]|nr:hypothetical protein JHK85_012800 [Glycine max]KAG5057471.1 hypothetical protein JHK86_012467 [Glycine max]KAG5154478.1 hypothetical protein JHK82_012447 [Glycine max]